MQRDQLMYYMRHKGKKVVTSVGSAIYESYVADSLSRITELGAIPVGYEHRPDLIANLFFGDPSDWWTFLEMNAILDPFEELNVADEVRLP